MDLGSSCLLFFHLIWHFDIHTIYDIVHVSILLCIVVLVVEVC